MPQNGIGVKNFLGASFGESLKEDDAFRHCSRISRYQVARSEPAPDLPVPQSGRRVARRVRLCHPGLAPDSAGLHCTVRCLLLVLVVS
ncbi:hypothetical protein CDAR_243191 [Caerostris darwini]|uniref:Uncharacterized protein n=1 Tax=Caerostris darwini TaxID=1538125 RepID=A0AAV4MR43_9ARAC|nr:hypothetical protein CDAR_243191 [Caerostris darwini]